MQTVTLPAADGVTRRPPIAPAVIRRGRVARSSEGMAGVIGVSSTRVARSAPSVARASAYGATTAGASPRSGIGSIVHCTLTGLSWVHQARVSVVGDRGQDREACVLDAERRAVVDPAAGAVRTIPAGVSSRSRRS